MRIITTEKMVAFIFDDAKDIEIMHDEIGRMLEGVKEGLVPLPTAFVGADDSSTEEDKAAFVAQMQETVE
jgi:hypothetical protein